MNNKHTQTSEEALTHTLETGYAAASAELEDAPHQYVENGISEMTLNARVKDLFIRNLKRWSHSPQVMKIFTQSVLNSGFFTHLLTTIAKKQIECIKDEYHLTIKEDSSHPDTNSDLTVPPSPTEAFLSDGLPIPTDCELDSGYRHVKKHKDQRKITKNYVSSFSTSFSALKEYALDSALSANSIEQHKIEQWELEEIRILLECVKDASAPGYWQERPCRRDARRVNTVQSARWGITGICQYYSIGRSDILWDKLM